MYATQRDRAKKPGLVGNTKACVLKTHNGRNSGSTRKESTPELLYSLGKFPGTRPSLKRKILFGCVTINLWELCGCNSHYEYMLVHAQVGSLSRMSC